MKTKQFTDFANAKAQACELVKYHGYDVMTAILVSVKPSAVLVALRLKDEMKEIF